VVPYVDIPAIPSYPFDGSALVVWDSGAATPPITNTAPTTGNDPHSDPRSSVAARNQKSEFLRTGGDVIDVCSGAPASRPDGLLNRTAAPGSATARPVPHRGRSPGVRARATLVRSCRSS